MVMGKLSGFCFTMHVTTPEDSTGHGLKTLEIIGSCQRLVFTVSVSQQCIK